MVGSLTPPPGYMKGLTCRTVRGQLRKGQTWQTHKYTQRACECALHEGSRQSGLRNAP